MEVKTSTYGELLNAPANEEVQASENQPQEQPVTETVNTQAQESEAQEPQTTAEAEAPKEENVASFSLGGEDSPAPSTVDTPVSQATFNLDEEIKKVDRKELLKKAGVSDFAIEIDEYLSKGGKAQDYLNAKAIDYNQISDEDLIKEDYRKTYPNFSRDEINRLFNRKYGITDEMLDEEKEDKLLELKADGYSKRQAKIAEQQSFKIPDTPILQKDEAYEQWKQQQETQPAAMEQLKNYYLNHDATKSLNESKRVAVSLGEGVQPFNFSIDNPEVLTRMYTDGGQTWQKLTSTKTGEPDVAKQQLIGLFSFDPHKYSQEIFNYGMQMGVKKKLVEEGQNAQKPQAKIASMETNTAPNVSVGKFSDRARN